MPRLPFHFGGFAFILRAQHKSSQEHERTRAMREEPMTKREYLRSVRRSRKIFGCIQITDTRMVPTKISKKKALELVSQISDDDEIHASWARNDNLYLLVGLG